jgi:hypothetical protein
MTSWLWIILGGVVLAVLMELRRRRALAVWVERGCAGRAWRRAFPQAQVVEIRAFLEIFRASFLLRKKWRLAFRPEDRPMEVYEAMYRGRFEPDAMELETFAIEVERRYGVDLEAVWKEGITLGEIFVVLKQG